MWVYFPTSKTDQAGEGLHIPIERSTDPTMDVITMVKRLIAILPSKRSTQPLFTGVYKCTSPICSGTANQIVKDMVTAAGLGTYYRCLPAPFVSLQSPKQQQEASQKKWLKASPVTSQTIWYLFTTVTKLQHPLLTTAKMGFTVEAASKDKGETHTSFGIQ